MQFCTFSGNDRHPKKIYEQEIWYFQSQLTSLNLPRAIGQSLMSSPEYQTFVLLGTTFKKKTLYMVMLLGLYPDSRLHLCLCLPYPCVALRLGRPPLPKALHVTLGGGRAGKQDI